MKKKLSILTFIVLSTVLLSVISSIPAFAETLILKSGEQIKGKIIRKTDQFIEIEQKGITIPYSLDEIKSIEETTAVSAIEQYTAEVGQCFLSGDYENALFSLQKAIELDPNNPDFLSGLGIIQYYLGHYQEAVSSLEKTLSFRPDDPNIYLSLGIVYDTMGKQDEARENLIKAADGFRKSTISYKVLVADILLKKLGK